MRGREKEDREEVAISLSAEACLHRSLEKNTQNANTSSRSFHLTGKQS